MHDGPPGADGATTRRDRAAEWLLSGIMPPDRASSIVGDLSERGAFGGHASFWTTVLRIGIAAARDSLLSLMELPMTETRVPFATFLGQRWPLLVAGMLAAVAVANLAITLAPSRFRSEAVILLEPRDDTSTGTRAEIFTAAMQKALSAAQLSPIIKDFDLYPTAQQEGGMDDAIDLFRRDIQVSFIHRSVVGVRYTDEQPRRAQQVTDRLAALLIAATEPRDRNVDVAFLSSTSGKVQELRVSGQVSFSGRTLEAVDGSFTIDGGANPEDVATVLLGGGRTTELLEAAMLPTHPLVRPRTMPSLLSALAGLTLCVLGSGVAWKRHLQQAS